MAMLTVVFCFFKETGCVFCCALFRFFFPLYMQVYLFIYLSFLIHTIKDLTLVFTFGHSIPPCAPGGIFYISPSGKVLFIYFFYLRYKFCYLGGILSSIKF